MEYTGPKVGGIGKKKLKKYHSKDHDDIYQICSATNFLEILRVATGGIRVRDPIIIDVKEVIVCR